MGKEKEGLEKAEVRGMLFHTAEPPAAGGGAGGAVLTCAHAHMCEFTAGEWSKTLECP